jgi:hypothetical protein
MSSASRANVKECVRAGGGVKGDLLGWLLPPLVRIHCCWTEPLRALVCRGEACTYRAEYGWCLWRLGFGGVVMVGGSAHGWTMVM